MAEEVRIEVYGDSDALYEENDVYEEPVVAEEGNVDGYEGQTTEETTTVNQVEAKPPQPVESNASTVQKENTQPTGQTTQRKTQKVSQKPVQKVKRKPKLRVVQPKKVVRKTTGFRIDWTSFFLGMGSAFVIYWSYKRFFKRGK